MFRVTRYPMISKTESGRVRYRQKYRVAGRVRVPAGHWFGWTSMQTHCGSNDLCLKTESMGRLTKRRCTTEKPIVPQEILPTSLMILPLT